MAEEVKRVPAGFHTITAYLLVPDAAGAVEFYKSAFGAEQMLYMALDDGRVMHAELKIGNSMLMIGDPASDPAPNAQIHLMLYVDDVDAWVKRAVNAGAKLSSPVEYKPEDADRRGAVTDPYGITWHIATQVRDVTRADLQAAYDESLKS
jgi:PhnB protein